MAILFVDPIPNPAASKRQHDDGVFVQCTCQMRCGVAGGEHHIEYQSPLNQAQKAGAGVAIMNTMNALAPLAQIDPKVMQRYNLDKAAERIGRINGVPEDIIRSDEEVAALDAQSQQAAQAQQLLAAAPVAAGAAKDFAQAASLAGSAPGQVAPNLGLPGA